MPQAGFELGALAWAILNYDATALTTGPPLPDYKSIVCCEFLTQTLIGLFYSF